MFTAAVMPNTSCRVFGVITSAGVPAVTIFPRFKTMISSQKYAARLRSWKTLMTAISAESFLMVERIST